MTRALTFLFCLFVLVGCQSTSSAPDNEDQLHAMKLVRIGDGTLMRGDTQTALSFYQRAHEQFPSNPLPLMRMGQVFQELKQWVPAADAYKSVLELTPRDLETKRALANIYLSQDEAGKAVSLLEEILDAQPNARAFNSLGVAYDSLGQHTLAQDWYKKGLKRSPDSLQLASNLALSYALVGSREKAILQMEGIVQRQEAGVKERTNLAMIYSLFNLHARAEEVLTQDYRASQVGDLMVFFNKLRTMPDSISRLQALRSKQLGN